MIILFIFGLILGAIAVIFALQNIGIITVTFFSWHLTGSLALILLLTIAAGILITILLLLPESIKNYFKYKHLKKENDRLEEELRKQKELTVFAKITPVSQEDIAKIDRGTIDSSIN
ncbi:MAG: lipopolysaccharide assembly protein LapA domain-containing protein [bacterium]